MKIKKLNPNAKVPTYGTNGAGCFDLYCAETVVLRSLEPTKIPTGLAFEVPEGYVMTVLPRSSTCMRGVLVFTGQVDSDYRGEVHVMASNISRDFRITIHEGTRIAQARLEKVEQTTFEVVDKLSATERGTNGYGSTGQ